MKDWMKKGWQRFVSLRSTRAAKRIRVAMIWTSSIVLLFNVYMEAVERNPFNLFGPMPPMKDLENPELDLSTEVISADGVCLGRYYRENRSLVSFDEIPQRLVKTLIISEDHRFFEHSGLDLRSYFRVLKGMITFERQGGGSTLTQQVAKNLFHTRSAGLQGRLASWGWPFEIAISKTKELIIAVELERKFTKEEIIAMYLNVVPYHYETFGIKAAAEVYFGKHLRQLNLQECALLVGMLQGTHRFNPVAFPDRARIKRNEVLTKLYTHHYIATSQQLDSLKALPVKLNFSPPARNDEPASYFVHNVLKQELENWCAEKGYDMTTAGLKVHVTIDTRVQRLAEQAMARQMSRVQKEFDRAWGNRSPWTDSEGREIRSFLNRKIQKTLSYKQLESRYGKNSDSLAIMLRKKKKMTVFTWQGDRDTLFSVMDSLNYYKRILQAGLMAMHPITGEVKAWVGGIDYTHFQYDHVRQGKRQAGSTFKPFVFGAAMESGYSPCFRLYDISPTIPVGNGIYHPTNYDGTYGGGELFTLRQAMARSLNSITMQLQERITAGNIIAFASRMGITGKMDALPSVALGTTDVSLFEMVAAYSAFVNAGTYTTPYYIMRIEDRNGNVLQSFAPKQRMVLDRKTAATLVHLLEGGVQEEGGTSRGLSAAVLADNDVGGKTGTTNDASDGWYIGITHNLVTGVWVGGDEPSIHLPASLASGSRSALPVWDLFMKEVYAHPETGIRKGYFKERNGEEMIECEEETESVFDIW